MSLLSCLNTSWWVQLRYKNKKKTICLKKIKRIIDVSWVYIFVAKLSLVINIFGAKFTQF